MAHPYYFILLRLQILIFMSYIHDARTRLVGLQNVFPCFFVD
jgi:hypothetical protein